MMDISDFYSSPAYAAGSTAAKREPRTASSAGVSQNKFFAEALAMHENNLFAGSTQRTELSDAEIAALANRYDPRDMSDEEYESFLDDLMDLGAISPFERLEMRASGLKIMDCGFQGWTSSGSVNSKYPYFMLWEAKGDVYRWITDRVTYKEAGPFTPEQELAASRRQAGYEALSSIVSRMAAVRSDGGEKAAEGESDLIDQIADPDSQFYQDMFHRMRLQLELSEEEKKEQAIIDTLGAILDGMRSADGAVKRKNMASSVAGLSKQISELDEEDPRKMELDLLRQRLNQLGIFVDLDLSVKDDKDGGWQTLTERLISEENQELDPSIFDLI